MSQKFLSPVKLSGISTGSILKVNSNGVIVAAVSGTDYLTSSTASQWTTTGNDIYYNTGNVGIGTTSPDGILHIKGSSQVTEFYIESSTGTSNTSGAIKIGQNNRAASNLGGEMVFSVQSSNVGGTFWREAMTILHTGWVGIGTSSPSTNFDVLGGAAVRNSNGGGAINVGTSSGRSQYQYITLGGVSGGTDYGWQLGRSPQTGGVIDDGFYIYDIKSNSTTFAIALGGNVGIGTASPVKTLVVNKSNSGGAGGYIRVQNEVGGAAANVGIDFATFSPEYYSITSLDPTAQIRATDISNYSGRLDVLVRGQGTSGVLSTVATFDRTGNVGIGTTGPNYKLEVYGTDAKVKINNTTSTNTNLTILDLTGTVQGSGTGNERAILFGKDGNIARQAKISYLQGTSNGQLPSLAFFTGDNVDSLDERMRIDSPGNVGIGTASPGAKLTVAGSAISISNGWPGNHDILFVGGSPNSTGSASQTAARIRSTASAPNGAATGDLLFTVNSGDTFVDALYIKEDGKVGIGTTSPTMYGSKGLEVASDQGQTGIRVSNSGTGKVEIGADSSGGYIQTAVAGNNLSFFTGAANPLVMRMTSDGNVGIGTTSPANVLDLGSGTSGRGLTWGNSNSIFSSYSAGSLVLSSNFYGSTATDTYLTYITATFGAAGIRVGATDGTSNGGLIRFFVDAAAAKTAGAAFTPTERMRITGDGNVGINITAPTEKLQVGGSAAITLSSTIDPDSYRDYVVIGYISDGGGWAAKGIGGNAGTGDSWAIGHNGSHLYFGIGNGTADNSLSTWMQVSPARAITLPSLASAGFLKTNASGTLSVDTNTYSLSGHTHTAATTSAAGFMSASDKTKLDGITDAADAYGYWRVSDGTNTENIASQNTLTFAADGSATVTYDTGTNTLTIGAAIVEADTLNTVVARGSTTTSAITLGPASTAGGPMIYQTYSSDDKIGSIGSEYSSGSMLIGYGAAGKNGGSGYVSTFDNFSSHRGLIRLSFGEFSILNTGSAVQTTTGDALTMTTRFVVNNDGNVGIGTTSPSYKLDVDATSIKPTANLLLGEAAYSVSGSYVGLKTTFMSGSNDYMIISGKSDGATYVSAKDGESVYIRGGGNLGSNQIVVPDGNYINIDTTTLNVSGGVSVGSNFIIQNGAGIYSIKSTINTSASGTAFKISNTNNVQAARATFVAETDSYKVAKIYEVVKAGDADPVAFKVVDTGPGGEEDFSVSFSNDGGDLLCTVTNGSANESLILVTTIFVGGSNTSQTVSNS